jgi:hypothetical protein
MQKQFTTLCATLALIVMLLVAVPKVNYSSTVPVWHSGHPLADGIPMPPPSHLRPDTSRNNSSDYAGGDLRPLISPSLAFSIYLQVK